MKAIPKVQKYMTTTPHSIGVDQSLSAAQKMMREYTIRHLPVMEGGKLRGIITDRDLKLAMGINGVDPEKTLIEEIATEDPYITTPEASLDEVVSILAERKIGSALVVDNHKLVGIFTATDALQAFVEHLHAKH
jgi:acetoin utilization protein AcuB